jgi:hypothetical protein
VTPSPGVIRPVMAVAPGPAPRGTTAGPLADLPLGGRWLGRLGRIVTARVLSGFTRQQLKPFLSVGKRQDLLTLADLVATGQATPVIDRPTPSTKQPTPSATSGPATPEGRSSSPSDDRTDKNDPTRAYARPNLPPLRRTDRSSRRKNR